jgi:hypothetical protein
MTKPAPGRVRKQEELLDRKIRLIHGKGPQDYSPEKWAGLREQLRLSLLYPGRFVAYRDHYKGQGNSLRLVRREVLCASRTLPGLNRQIARLPLEEQQGICVSYVEPEQGEGSATDLIL